MQVATQNSTVPRLRFKEFGGDWEEKKLEEIILDFIVPMRDKPKNLSGNIPWCRIEDFNGKYLSKSKSSQGVSKELAKEMNLKIYPVNTVLVSCSANLGFCSIVKKPLITNQTFIGLFPSKFIDSEFLLYFMRLSARKLNTLSSGTTISYLSRKQFEKFKLHIPEINEQEKIASFLSAVDEIIQQLERKKSLLEVYKKGVMRQLFSQEIRFKDENGNNYPDWEERKLREVAEYRRGSFPQPYGLKKWYDDENGFPFIQVFDVADNMKLKSETKRKISEEAKALSVYVKKGTIVLTIQGSIGRIAITQYDACVDRTLLIFQSFKHPIDTVFFTYVVFLLFEIEKRNAPGGTIKTITKEVLSNFKVKLPSLEEQQKIASFLSGLDKKIELVDMQIQQSKTFKKGLLQQMFV